MNAAVSNFTNERIAAIRQKVMDELNRVASFGDGSPELKEFNARVMSRVIETERQLANFVNDIQNWFSRMSELNAALGIAYLDHMDEIIRLKADISRTYRKTHGFDWQRISFASNNYIVAGLVPSSSDMRKKNPDWEFRDYYQTMADENDETTSFEKALYPTVPIHLQSDLAITRYVSRHILAFPSWPQMPLEYIKELKT